MWVSFKDRRPRLGKYVEGDFLITRFPSMDGKGDYFESWETWKGENLQISYPNGTGKITHWWEGQSDLDIAMSAWLKQQPN